MARRPIKKLGSKRAPQLITGHPFLRPAGGGSERRRKEIPRGKEEEVLRRLTVARSRCKLVSSPRPGERRITLHESKKAGSLENGG